jgi:hypothetical protein
MVAACSSGGPADSTTTTAARSRPSTTTSSTPTFTGDAQSAFCTLLRGVDTSTVLGGDPGDPTAVEAAFHRLVGLLRDAHALAPPEIAADLALVSGGIAALDGALGAVGYDFDALAASGDSAAVVRAVNDPAFAQAGTRLSAYRTQVCQL